MTQVSGAGELKPAAKKCAIQRIDAIERRLEALGDQRHYKIECGDTLYNLAEALKRENAALRQQGTMALVKALQAQIEPPLGDIRRLQVGTTLDLSRYLNGTDSTKPSTKPLQTPEVAQTLTPTVLPPPPGGRRQGPTACAA